MPLAADEPRVLLYHPPCNSMVALVHVARNEADMHVFLAQCGWPLDNVQQVTVGSTIVFTADTHTISRT